MITKQVESNLQNSQIELSKTPKRKKVKIEKKEIILDHDFNNGEQINDDEYQDSSLKESRKL